MKLINSPAAIILSPAKGAPQISGVGAPLCRRLQIPSRPLNSNLRNRPRTNPRFFQRSFAPSLFTLEFHFLEGSHRAPFEFSIGFPLPSFIFLLCGTEVSAWGFQMRTFREKSHPSLPSRSRTLGNWIHFFGILARLSRDDEKQANTPQVQRLPLPSISRVNFLCVCYAALFQCRATSLGRG